MKHKVLVIQRIHQAGIDLLAKEAEVVIASSTDPEQVKKELADCDGCIVRVSPLPADVINSAPKLKVIGRHGVGAEVRKACTGGGGTPGGYGECVAYSTLGDRCCYTCGTGDGAKADSAAVRIIFEKALRGWGL